MRVRDLIDTLNGFDPESPVVIYLGDPGDTTLDIEDIEDADGIVYIEVDL